MKDSHGRTIDYLRISLTDRCNLRCVYCMPQQGVEWVAHSAVLSYEQLLRLVGDGDAQVMDAPPIAVKHGTRLLG